MLTRISRVNSVPFAKSVSSLKSAPSMAPPVKRSMLTWFRTLSRVPEVFFAVTSEKRARPRALFSPCPSPAVPKRDLTAVFLSPECSAISSGGSLSANTPSSMLYQ